MKKLIQSEPSVTR